MTEICAICRYDLSGIPTYTLPECGHIMHTECLISYFRSPRDPVYHSYSSMDRVQTPGLCPLCRGPPKCSFPYLTMKGRVKVLQQCARKKDIHPQLRKALIRLKKAKLLAKSARKANIIFRKENREILKEDRNRRQNYYKMRRRVRECEAELATFDPMIILHPQINI